VGFVFEEPPRDFPSQTRRRIHHSFNRARQSFKEVSFEEREEIKNLWNFLTD
jgi:hypothetical protein